MYPVYAMLAMLIIFSAQWQSILFYYYIRVGTGPEREALEKENRTVYRLLAGYDWLAVASKIIDRYGTDMAFTIPASFCPISD